MGFLIGVMENDADRVPRSGSDSANAVPEVDPIRSPCPSYRSMMDGKCYCVSLAKRDDFWSRLHPGSLFCQHEFAARKVSSWLREQNGHLNRKYMLPIEILVQTVVVACPILKQQRRWPLLTCIMASLEEIAVDFRIVNADTHGTIPCVCDRCKPWIQG